MMMLAIIGSYLTEYFYKEKRKAIQLLKEIREVAKVGLVDDKIRILEYYLYFNQLSLEGIGTDAKKLYELKLKGYGVVTDKIIDEAINTGVGIDDLFDVLIKKVGLTEKDVRDRKELHQMLTDRLNKLEAERLLAEMRKDVSTVYINMPVMMKHLRNASLQLENIKTDVAEMKRLWFRYYEAYAKSELIKARIELKHAYFAVANVLFALKYTGLKPSNIGTTASELESIRIQSHKWHAEQELKTIRGDSVLCKMEAMNSMKMHLEKANLQLEDIHTNDKEINKLLYKYHLAQAEDYRQLAIDSLYDFDANVSVDHMKYHLKEARRLMIELGKNEFEILRIELHYHQELLKHFDDPINYPPGTHNQGRYEHSRKQVKKHSEQILIIRSKIEKLKKQKQNKSK